jgi:phenylalanyl-tRNA synthetase beta chain
MKVTYNWLKEFVNIDIPVKELAEKLTLAGPEVVAIKKTGIDKDNAAKILLGKTAEVKNHPQSENLKICTISAHKASYQVITNSKNIEKGAYVVLALPGTKLLSGMEIKEAEMKGEKSQGMLLAKEHLNLEEKSQDIWILGKNDKAAKTLFEQYTQEDYVLEIELTANRSDCLSIIGIAREVAAMTDKDLNVPKSQIQETLEDVPPVEIKDKELCPRYSARILKGVQVMDSPEWLKRKLELCGIRPINNIVDATNYVLLEYGHPMHSFDLDRLEGREIKVRKAHKNEKFKTLDSQEHTLNEEMLVITDAKKAVALAGIMGGENSEILSTTKDILLESAYFDPISIRRTAKKLGLKTESSYRFERTADWGITVAALERATEIILTTCTPQVSKIRDEYINIIKDKVVTVKTDFIASKIGIEITQKQIEGILKRLKFAIVGKREDALETKVPSFRSDISKSIDIVEEVARIYGYNNIPATSFKPRVDVESLRPVKEIKDKVREVLGGIGFTEVYNYSFTNEQEMSVYDAMEDNVLKLQNPLSQDASLMRNYLFGGLLKTIDFNVKTAYRNDIKIFELGRTFVGEKNSYLETRKAGIALFGSEYSYYSISGIAEMLLKKMGKKPVEFRKISRKFLHPVNSAEIFFDGKPVGFLGEIHPDIIEKLGLRNPVYAAEIETQTLSDALNEPIQLKQIGKFPPTTRDISLVIGENILAREVMMEIEKAHPLIRQIEYVDLFKGVQVGPDKKSVTFNITFQSAERTLTDAEVNEAMNILIEKTKARFQAELRS